MNASIYFLRPIIFGYILYLSLKLQNEKEL
jgi:hypothetical protein